MYGSGLFMLKELFFAVTTKSSGYKLLACVRLEVTSFCMVGVFLADKTPAVNKEMMTTSKKKYFSENFKLVLTTSL